MGVLSALLVELALITYRGATGVDKRQPIAGLPVPAEYAGAFLVFGALSLIPGRGKAPATVFAWGLVIATALNLYPENGTRVDVPGLTFISPSSNYSTVRPVNLGAVA